MTNMDNGFRCNTCGKLHKKKKLIINHIETIHIEGGSHSCIQCGNTYKTRISLKNHSCSKNDEQTLPMMTHTDNGWVCKICGKCDKKKGNIKYHIASIHIKK